LLLLDVDADEADAGMPAPGRRPRRRPPRRGAGTRLELGVVADQPMSPVLRLLDKAMLLAYAVAVDVLGDASRLGSTAQAAARIA
jgi:hypothetical protein